MIQYAFFPPDNRLSEYISSYGTMEIPAATTVSLLSPPNGLTGFLLRIKADENAVVAGKDFEGNAIAHQQSYAIGQTTYPITGFATGQITFLIIFFQPLGMYQLFGKKMGPLTNTSVCISHFLGCETAALLLKELQLDDDRVRQIKVLDEFFLKQPIEEKDCAQIKQVLQHIHFAQGNINIKSIETSLWLNRRTLERQFRDKIGISPKVYAQIYRFKSAMNYLQANPKATWTDISNKHGFFDQAHMIRYFKEYLKVSPNNVVQLDLDFINYLLQH